MRFAVEVSAAGLAGNVGAAADVADGAAAPAAGFVVVMAAEGDEVWRGESVMPARSQGFGGETPDIYRRRSREDEGD